ncbi:MAG: DUF4193 family protein [Acidimicrobiales bacterium]|jgi:hypothetical protein
MADDLEDVVEPEELVDEELDELPDEELDDKDLDEDLVDDLEADDLTGAELGVELPVGKDPLAAAVLPEVAAVAVPTVEEGEDDEEEVDDEDVEASLDEILKERLVVEEEEDDVPETEDRSEISERVLPKQPDEFVCSSCFLVKHSSQLADPSRRLCRDCV